MTARDLAPRVAIATSGLLGEIVTVTGVSGGACPFRCVYCDRHESPTTRRRRTAEPAAVLRELDRILDSAADVRYVVVDGPGDPLLWTALGDFFRALARRSIPLAVITPGPLLSRPTVRRSLDPVSLTIVKLDAVTPQMLRAVSRPHRGIRIGRMLEGLHTFRACTYGRLWVETVIVTGVNDTDHHLTRLVAVLDRMAPARFLLRTAGHPAPANGPGWSQLLARSGGHALPIPTSSGSCWFP